ncbi:MAG: hypothetical protein CSB21_01940 [Deltaproteobacteria bacterium]|nr:MAG: hypothetical protein CSB21_01940 [Deltaproteobacteria bacterium]
MKKTKPEKNNDFLEEDNNSIWIVTFSDLMTLILVFFILLFSMSNMNKKKFEKIADSIKTSLKSDSSYEYKREFIEDYDRTNKRIRIDELTGLKAQKKKIKKDLESYIKKHKIKDKVFVSQPGDKIVIQVMGTALFDSGDAVLKKTAIPILKELVAIFDAYDDYDINIKGHTDNLPIATTKYPSNWELSAIRATNVLRFLINEKINPSRLTATGYGSLMPLRPNSSPENRAVNRRVEFVLGKKKN